VHPKEHGGTMIVFAVPQADLARRRFVAVEPENRLVARNLEKDWNEKLAVVEQLAPVYKIFVQSVTRFGHSPAHKTVHNKSLANAPCMTCATVFPAVTCHR
jgi:hypothetical protein